MGKHSKGRHRNRHPAPKGMVKMVDIRTGENHLLTPDAAAGREATGRCLALCGVNVLPESLSDPGQGYCWACRSIIPESKIERRPASTSTTVTGCRPGEQRGRLATQPST